MMIENTSMPDASASASASPKLLSVRRQQNRRNILFIIMSLLSSSNRNIL